MLAHPRECETKKISTLPFLAHWDLEGAQTKEFWRQEPRWERCLSVLITLWIDFWPIKIPSTAQLIARFYIPVNEPRTTDGFNIRWWTIVSRYGGSKAKRWPKSNRLPREAAAACGSNGFQGVECSNFHVIGLLYNCFNICKYLPITPWFHFPSQYVHGPSYYIMTEGVVITNDRKIVNVVCTILSSCTYDPTIDACVSTKWYNAWLKRWSWHREYKEQRGHVDIYCIRSHTPPPLASTRSSTSHNGSSRTQGRTFGNGKPPSWYFCWWAKTESCRWSLTLCSLRPVF